jgi:hypothetical protein
MKRSNSRGAKDAGHFVQERVVRRDVVEEMRVGPSESPCGRGLQTFKPTCGGPQTARPPASNSRAQARGDQGLPPVDGPRDTGHA